MVAGDEDSVVGLAVLDVPVVDYRHSLLFLSIQTPEVVGVPEA